jgi:sigma-B regulation protein RsbU (phosphoserine phosphatase)
MARKLRVLLVEDSDFDAELLLRLLGRGGYEVYHERVETAEEFREALQHEWHLVIADYNLPQFSAPEALQIVKASGRDIPFIIVSGGIGESTAVAAMKAGAHDYLMKDNLARLVPVVERELREAVNRDIKKQTKEALQESELRYRLLWETATDAVILFDEQGRVAFANPAVEEVFGYKAGELVDKEIFILQPEEFHWDAGSGLRSFLASKDPGRKWRARETMGIRKDGNEIPVETAFSHMQVGERGWFVVFFRDVTERKRAEKELRQNQEQFRVAREIQQHLFPKAAPNVPGFEIAGASFPAEATGGDYFDYLRLLKSCYGIVVGDVTGHGVGPALLMAETRAYLRILARDYPDAGAILTQANQVLAEDVGYERYVTLFFLRLDPTRRELAYVNAGNIPGYIFGASGEVLSSLKRTGVPLGLRKETTYSESALMKLSPGQSILLLTDGFEEAVSPEEEVLGTERVLETYKANSHLPAEEIIRALHEAVHEFTKGAPQTDDLTGIVIKVK